MKWVKCIDRLPEENGSYFVIGKMGRGSIPFKDGVWGADHPHMRVFEEVCEWLDEDNVSFTLEDMKKCWRKCDSEHSERSGCGLPIKLFNNYMKEKYKIEIQ